jgi:hypothetical protein
MSDLAALIERVRYPGVDRGLNGDLWFLAEGLTNLGGYRAKKADGTVVPVAYIFPDYDSSIDDAVGLVDRMLKVYSLTITIDPSGNGAKLTWWPEGLTGERQVHADEVSESITHAILAALLTALSTQESPK